MASAILGGRITKHWVDITEGGVVIARGKSAVRSLKLLLRNTAALEARIREFRLNDEAIEKYPEVTRRNFEEIIGTCNLLQEETVNSIENWTDIIPEADITTQIGVISDLKITLNDKEEDLLQLNTNLEQAKGESEQERNDLKEKIHKKELQINGLEREIYTKKIGLQNLGLLANGTSATGRLQDIALRRGFTNVSGGTHSAYAEHLAEIQRKTNNE